MSNKVKNIFFCSNCGHESAKWLGKCPACGEWNTFVEEKVVVSKKSTIKGKQGGLVESSSPIKISEIEINDENDVMDNDENTKTNEVINNKIKTKSSIIS